MKQQSRRIGFCISLGVWTVFAATLSTVYAADDTASVHLGKTMVPCSFWDTTIRGCDECGELRQFFGKKFGVWLWFNNNIPGKPEILFSGRDSSVTIYEMGNLSKSIENETHTKTVSSYMPKDFVNVQGLSRVLIFNVNDLKFSNHPDSRDEIAARLVYDTHYSVPSVDGHSSSHSMKFNYTDGEEVVENGVPRLKAFVHHDKEESTKYFYTSTPPRRRIVTCLSLYVSWCGDGVTEKENPAMCQPKQ